MGSSKTTSCSFLVPEQRGHPRFNKQWGKKLLDQMLDKPLSWNLGFLTVCFGGRSEEEQLNASSGEGSLLATCPSFFGTTPSALTLLGELIHPPIGFVANLRKPEHWHDRTNGIFHRLITTHGHSTTPFLLGLGPLLLLRWLLYNHPLNIG